MCRMYTKCYVQDVTWWSEDMFFFYLQVVKITFYEGLQKVSENKIHILKPLCNFLFIKYVFIWTKMFVQTFLKKWEMASLRSWMNFPSSVSSSETPMSIY